MTTVHDGLQRYYEGMEALRERALRRLRDHFTEDIHFRDPFRDTHGIEALEELFVRMFKQYKEVSFRNFQSAGDEASGGFALFYDMRMRMAVGPTFLIKMASVCRVRDGRVSELYDYYDLSSCLLSPFPALGRVYTGVVNSLLL